MGEFQLAGKESFQLIQAKDHVRKIKETKFNIKGENNMYNKFLEDVILEYYGDIKVKCIDGKYTLKQYLKEYNELVYTVKDKYYLDNQVLINNHIEDKFGEDWENDDIAQDYQYEYIDSQFAEGFFRYMNYYTKQELINLSEDNILYDVYIATEAAELWKV